MSLGLASIPFGEHYAAEIDDLWLTEVDPAIAAIRSEFAEHGLVREVVRHFGVDFEVFLSGGATCVAVGVTSLNGLAAAAAGLGTLSLQAAAKVVVARRDKQRELASRDLFYLYEVNHRLSSS